MRWLKPIASAVIFAALLGAGCTSDPPGWSLNWFQAMTETSGGWMIGPALAYGMVAILGAALVMYRMYRGAPLSPGEMLLVILGAHQVVFWPMFCILYRQWIIGPYPPPQHGFALLFLPRLAACVAIWIAWTKFRSVAGWNIHFMGMLVLFVLATLDSSPPHSGRLVEESLVTSIPPIVTGIAAFAAVIISLVGPRYGLRLHWCGIIMAFLPAVWFAICWIRGTVPFRPWFMRAID